MDQHHQHQHQQQQENHSDMLFSSSDWNQAMLFQEQRVDHLHQPQPHLLLSPSPPWSFTPPASPPSCSPCANRKFPPGLAQKIGYLQMVIQMLGNSTPRSSVSATHQAHQAQEQIGQLVDQLLVTARGMFLEQQQPHQPPGTLPLHTPQLLQPETAYQPPRFPHLQDSSVHGILPKSEPWTLPENNITGLQGEGVGVGVFGGGELEEEEALEAALPPESCELIELDAMEILAEHTHFCEICGKGFKRDANLRMHMRGHGDEYKTPAALARPKVDENDPVKKPSTRALTKRYSCPYVGCKRNKQHKKFVPLKTVLCVKNHYRRSHCPKLLSCTRCRVKRFAVLADLKTHEKHCGREKWQCSCGTTFSRKDKLLGHIALFIGHKPMMMLVPALASQTPVILPTSSSSTNNNNNNNGSFQTELPPGVGVYNLEQLGYSTSTTTGNSSLMNHSVNQLEVDVASSGATNGEAGMCWSPDSMFAAAMGNNSGGHVGQESNTSSSGGDNNSLGFHGLDFFDCKS